MNEFLNFDEISRKNWKNLSQENLASLTEEELSSIRSLNDEISLQDVTDVYLPLIRLIRLYKKNLENMLLDKALFLKKITSKSPLIIGITGPVAVGKSTTARLLQLLLSRSFKDASVELVTTDGFLYDYKTLKEKNLLEKKGFPESYDTERFLEFLYQMKNGEDDTIPVYSHEIYDILPDYENFIANPDILIVEGINVLQNPDSNNLYIHDFYDLTLYIDAKEEQIETWYLERFDSLLNLAKKDTNNFYHQFTKMDDKAAKKIAKSTWRDINLVNLKNYIQPTRNRAEIILHKKENHKIDKIYLKKF